MHYIRTTTTISLEDAKFIEEHHLSVAQLLRERCAQLRQTETVRLELEHAQKKLEKQSELLNTRIRFIAEKKQLEEFFEWEKQNSLSTK